MISKIKKGQSTSVNGKASPPTHQHKCTLQLFHLFFLDVFQLKVWSLTEWLGIAEIGANGTPCYCHCSEGISVMHALKNQLCNWMGEERMNDCLVTCIKKDIFNSIKLLMMRRSCNASITWKSDKDNCKKFSIGIRKWLFRRNPLLWVIDVWLFIFIQLINVLYIFCLLGIFNSPLLIKFSWYPT